MIITKIIETGLAIINPIHIYADEGQNLMNLLINNYCNKCTHGCYVLQILRILDSTPCEIASLGGNCEGKINIKFEVKAIVYAPGEVINGCKITYINKSDHTRTNTSIIYASAKYANISISLNKTFESLKSGQLISIRVDSAIYNKTAENISVNGLLYYPNKYIYENIKMPIFKINEILKLNESQIERIKLAEDLHKELLSKDAKKFEFITNILYPFIKNDIAANKINLDNISNIKLDQPLYVWRDPHISLYSPEICYVIGEDNLNKATEYTSNKVIRELPNEQVSEFLVHDYCEDMRIINEYITIYNTNEQLLLHKNLWAIYQKLKK